MAYPRWPPKMAATRWPPSLPLTVIADVTVVLLLSVGLFNDDVYRVIMTLLTTTS